MRRRWFAIPVVLIMVALVACGPEDKPGAPATPGAPTDAIALAKKYAPLVILGEGEKYKPIDTETFIEKAKLMWNREKCFDEEVDEHPTAQKLGDPAAYRARKTQGNTACLGKEDKEYNTTDRTRPFDNEELGEEGYFLDADNDIHDDGDVSGAAAAPAYVEYVEGKDGNAGRAAYVYWFFYPYNRWTNPAGGVGGNHEGDWERVTVVTDTAGQPAGVVLSQHLTKCLMDWKTVAGPDGHPVVYSAIGSHGSYPVGDARYKIDGMPEKLKFLEDRTSTKGEKWQTWGNLKEVAQEPWWRYAGGWGEVGAPINIKIPKGPKIELDKLQTGPAGPSPIKHDQMIGEAFTTDACPAPEPKETPKPKPTEPPEGKLAAIARLEEYLHATGRHDVTAACAVAAPDIRPLCLMALPQAFKEMSKKEQEALRTAKVDPGKVPKASKTRCEVPPEALPAATGMGDGTAVMIYLDGEWYLTM